MNFNKIPPVNGTKQCLDAAFRQSKKLKERGMPRISDKTRRKAVQTANSITVFGEELGKQLETISRQFPNTNSLSEFYYQLTDETIGVDNYKKALGRINESARLVSSLTSKYASLARKSESPAGIWKEYLGRASSVANKLSSTLNLLDGARKTMRNFPAVKEGMFTVAIAGFPNVGKSTLLSKITPSRPEIGAYAFTTKTLNFGYMKSGYNRIQLIDTPGTLARPDKMNMVEKQAYAALRYLADAIVFVYDPTNGEENQIKLFKKVAEAGKETLVYVSKADIASQAEIASALSTFPDAYTDSELLKIKLKELHKVF